MAIKKVTLLSLDNADESQLDNLYSLGSEFVNGRKKSVKVAMSLLRGNTAFREWQERNPGKTYADWIKLLQEPAQTAADGIDELKDDLTEFGKGMVAITETGKKVIVATEQVKTDTNAVKEATEQVKADTLAMKEATDKVRQETLSVKEATEQVKTDTNTVKEATEQVKADTLAMKEATDKVRQETLSVKEATEQVKTDTNTVKEATEQVKADTLAMKEATDKVRQETLSVKEATEQVKTDTNTVKEATEQVKADTLSVKADTIELNAHPMCIRGGIWFSWSIEKHDYENTGIQAKGDVGASFKIIGRYDTLDELKAAIPDGKDIDGVYAVGAVEPFDYYTWLVVDGVWQWDNQGKLRGAEGKSSYEVWEELPENEGKTLDEYFDYLSPLIDPETGRWIIQGEDTKVQAVGINAEVTEKENTEDSYILHVKSAKGEFDTPNIRGISVKVTETKNTPDTYILTFKHAKGEFTTPNLRGFDVKVREVETNTPDDYKLEITTVEGILTTPNLKGRSGSAVIDIDHEPTEIDTHYVYNNTLYAFCVGDEIRWYDKDSEEYVLFKLYAVTEAGAIWEEMGSGSGSLATDVILTGPSDLSSDESESYIYLEDGYLKGKEE